MTASVQECFAAVFGYLAKAHARFLFEHQDIASSAGKVMNGSGGYDETIPSAEDLKFYEEHHPGAAFVKRGQFSLIYANSATGPCSTWIKVQTLRTVPVPLQTQAT